MKTRVVLVMWALGSSCFAQDYPTTNPQLGVFCAKPNPVANQELVQRFTVKQASTAAPLLAPSRSSMPQVVHADPQRQRVGILGATLRFDDRWPSRTIPFHFDGVSEQNRVLFKAATRLWASVAPLTFKEADKIPDRLYIKVSDTDKTMCSHTDKRGGRFTADKHLFVQIGDCGRRTSINFPPNPLINVVHEIGHALGLQHEHTRPDRNTYVKLNPEAMQTENERDQYAADFFEDLLLIVSRKGIGDYDLLSMMHYPVGSAMQLREGRGRQRLQEQLGEGNILGDEIIGQVYCISILDAFSVNQLFQSKPQDIPN